MKHHLWRTVVTGFSIAAFLALSGVLKAESAIDLRRPVEESLPEISGIYWK